MDNLNHAVGIEIIAAALLVLLCVMVFNVIIRSYKIRKIHKRVGTISGISSIKNDAAPNAQVQTS